MSTRAGIDFTSALFLGMRHDARSIPAWTSLTTGTPAVLGEASSARTLGESVARAQGAECGLVARSTLHALTDVMGLLPRAGDVVAIDKAAYPIAQWATLLARGRGVTVRSYPHHQPTGLHAGDGQRLLLVTDGWCPGCNRPAPLRQLQTLARTNRGLVLVDDSLACGILGRRESDDSFGDGSGTPRWSGTDHSGLLWVASFAKAYGAPLAVITGERAVVERLTKGGNRMHSSQPSSADLGAATNALRAGPVLQSRRVRLRRHVCTLRHGLLAAGLPVNGLPFPVVGVRFHDSERALQWWSELRDDMGIHTVVQHPRCQDGALLSAVLRSDHADGDVALLTNALRVLARRREAA